jgi:protein-tyrosine phosphatase
VTAGQPGGEALGWRARVHLASSQWYGPRAGNAGLSWIGRERIAIGSVPTAESALELAGQGVTHIVNCRTRAQVLVSQDLAVERMIFGTECVRHAPMRDLGHDQHPRLWAPAAHFAADTLDREPEARVLIHCQQGRRRSAMLAYAVLRLRGHDAETAATLILRHRIQAELVPAYVQSVERWLASAPPG